MVSRDLAVDTILFSASLFVALLALLLAMLEMGTLGPGSFLVLYSASVVSMVPVAFVGIRGAKFRLSASFVALLTLLASVLLWALTSALRSDVPETAIRSWSLALDGGCLFCVFSRLTRLRPRTAFLCLALSHLIALALLKSFPLGFLGVQTCFLSLGLVVFCLAAAILGAGRRVGRFRWLVSLLLAATMFVLLVAARLQPIALGWGPAGTRGMDPSRQAAIGQIVRNEFLAHPLGGIGPGVLTEHLRGYSLSLPSTAGLAALGADNEKRSLANLLAPGHAYATDPRAVNSLSLLAVGSGAVGFALAFALFLYVFFMGVGAAWTWRRDPLSLSLTTLLLLSALAVVDGSLGLSLASAHGILAVSSIGGTIWGIASRLRDSPVSDFSGTQKAAANVAAVFAVPKDRGAGGKRAPVLAVALLVVAGVSIWPASGRYRGARTASLAAAMTDIADARRAFDRALRTSPLSAEIPYRYATYLRRSLQERIREQGWNEAFVEEIVGLYRHSIRLNPYREEYYAALVDFYTLLRRYEPGRETLSQAAPYCPNSLLLTRWETRLAETVGDPDLLERSLRRAIRLASAGGTSPQPAASLQLGFLAQLRDFYDRLDRPEKSRETQAQIVLLVPDAALPEETRPDSRSGRQSSDDD